MGPSTCPAGEGNATTGATTATGGCAACAAGTSSALNAPTCTACAAGTYSGASATVCCDQNCPEGKLTTTMSGAIAIDNGCTECRKGTFSTGGKALKCLDK